jgi:hypothetical protein
VVLLQNRGTNSTNSIFFQQRYEFDLTVGGTEKTSPITNGSEQELSYEFSSISLSKTVLPFAC